MLKLLWVRQHLKSVLSLLVADDHTLTLAEIHRRLELCHQYLQDLQPHTQHTHSRNWERWSLLHFHFQRGEVVAEVTEARQLLRGTVNREKIQLAHQALLRLHYRMVDISGSN